MVIAWVLCALGLVFGAGLGARALIDPKWAQRFARLRPDDQGGGFAEFRATYGGAVLFGHLTALALTGFYALSGGFVIGVCATGAVAVLSAAWGGACLGRLIAIWRDDGARTRFNTLSAAVEAAMALAIGAPWVLWVLGFPA